MTIELGYQLSSEEHPAPDLVGYARRAEEVGFSYARRVRKLVRRSRCEPG
ncbi:MAG: hypothetical protein ACRDKU_02010 [Gaiellaceae bacterium]